MPSIINATTSTGLVSSADNSGSLQLATNNGTTAVTIDSSQNVGIGTTSPAVKCHVSSSAGVALRIDNPSGTSAGVQSFLNGNLTSAVDFSTSGTIFYQNAGSGACPERMRIDSSGSIFIATTNTAPSINNVFGIALNRDGNGNYAAGVVQFSANGSAAINLNRGSDDGQTMNFRRSGSSVGNIQVTTSATSYNSSSDYRLKDNIAPMTGALDTVSALKPCTYKWKIDGSNGQGFIAHELAEVVPEAVSGKKDAVETYTDEDGNEQTRIVPQGIDTSFLVATLTAAIQELNAKVEAQAVRIAELEGAK
jgi:hypothetical protein